MQRRAFVKAAVSIPPVAVLETFLSAHARGQAPSSPDLHVVGAGEDRFGKTHSLGFSTLAFKVGTEETAGGLFMIEHRHLTPGGPPLHMHPHQEEWFYVMEGGVVFQVGEKRVELHPGESVLAPRAVPHTFSSLTESSGMLIAFCPAGKMEQYFRDAEQHKGIAGSPEFINRYDMEWIGPSPFWKAKS